MLVYRCFKRAPQGRRLTVGKIATVGQFFALAAVGKVSTFNCHGAVTAVRGAIPKAQNPALFSATPKTTPREEN